MRETEVKFTVPDDFVLPSDLEVGASDVRELPALRLRATYYDTRDLRLARSGVTLRYRTGDPSSEGWDLKLPVPGTDGTSREEIHRDGSPERMPHELRELVTAFARTEELVRVAALRTNRGRWSMRDASGDELAVVSDDDVTVLKGRRVVAHLRELEVESSTDNGTAMGPIVEALGERGAERGEPLPKLVRALGPVASRPPDVVVVGRVPPTDPAGAAVVAALARSVARLILHDPIARVGKDPEGVHQMRVAVRRLRSDLKTFESLVEADWAGGLRGELRWLGDALGHVRDMDVMLESVSDTGGDMGDDLEPLVEDLTTKRSEARSALLEAMRSERYVALLDELVDAAQTPRLTQAADTPSRKALPPLVAAAWKRLKKSVTALGKTPTNEQLHRVRIRAKKARYAAEAVADALGGRSRDARRLAKRCERIQDLLGEHQDAIVAGELIREAVARRARSGRFAFAAGRLHARQEQVARAARGDFERRWKRADTNKVTAWLRT